MAKLYLGTREITPAFYKNGAAELSSYVVSSGVVSKNTKVLDGTEFLDVVEISDAGWRYAFWGCGFGGSLNLQNLVTIGASGIQGAFDSCQFTSVNFDNLTTVGQLGMYQVFNQCRFSTCNFKKLTNLSASFALRNAFQSMSSYLQSLYFPALTTSSFGTTNTNQFTTMLTGSQFVTIHFPSNLESTIQGLNGYPTFGGAQITLAFDLPATS